MKIHQTSTVIVGAGPAGLAVAGRLRKLGQEFVLLEKSDCLTSAWRGHYDRLHLHTVREHSGLPHFPIPGTYPRYLSREQAIQYWQDYARQMDIEPRFGQEVVLVKRVDDSWETQTKTNAFRSQNVVVCTGYNRVPHRPHWPGEEEFTGLIIHSADYRNGEPFRGKKVLIIGMGNTGAELAIDLHEHGAEPWISVRQPVNIMAKEFKGRPAQPTAIFLSHFPDWITDRLARWAQRRAIGDLSAYGLTTPPMAASQQLRTTGRVPVIDVGTVELIRRGNVKILPGVARFHEKTIAFTDGRELPFDAVIAATGFRSKIEEFIENPDGLLNERGHPKALWVDDPHYRGLYFLGFELPTAGILRGIKLDSEKIVKKIVATLKKPLPPRH
ncbi:MAG: NAD(P)/FAD-dependent oxidoreductase [Cytophagaceae bacterium]|nr:NAD(P)/FAD-dependent oxidoreductase [Cytophagaceae bacterium]